MDHPEPARSGCPCGSGGRPGSQESRARELLALLGLAGFGAALDLHTEELLRS